MEYEPDINKYYAELEREHNIIKKFYYEHEHNKENPIKEWHEF